MQGNAKRVQRVRRRGGLLTALVALTLFAPTPRAVADGLRRFRTPGHVSWQSPRDPVDFSGRLAWDESLVLPGREEPLAEAVWRLSHTLSRAEAYDVAAVIRDEATGTGLDPWLVVAVMRVESWGNHLAISPVGAEGLMQLMPPTARWTAERNNLHLAEDRFEPLSNVQIGIRYLAFLSSRFRSAEQVLTAYNRGPTSTRRLLRRHGGRLPAVVRHGYAGKVLTALSELKRTYVVAAPTRG